MADGGRSEHVTEKSLQTCFILFKEGEARQKATRFMGLQCDLIIALSITLVSDSDIVDIVLRYPYSFYNDTLNVYIRCIGSHLIIPSPTIAVLIPVVNCHYCHSI